MLKSFVEDHNSDQVEATARGCYEFDWEAVEIALGEAPLTEIEQGKVALALTFLLDWMFAVDLRRKTALKSVGMRALAAAWVVDPKRFNNDSIRSLAKQLGCTAPNISPLTAEFTRITGIRNEYQNHDWKNANEKKAGE